jgi:hypothetical protein
VLDPEAHLAAAPGARAGVRGHGLVLLIEGERGGHDGRIAQEGYGRVPRRGP